LIVVIVQAAEQVETQAEAGSHLVMAGTENLEASHQEEGKACQEPFQAKAGEYHPGKEAYPDQLEEEDHLGMEAYLACSEDYP